MVPPIATEQEREYRVVAGSVGGLGDGGAFGKRLRVDRGLDS